MVTFPTDPDQIRSRMKKYFNLDPKHYEIDQGVVNVPAWSVRSHGPIRQMPVQFGYVSGFFDVSGSGLISLEGSPHTVDGGFHARSLEISNLVGGPKHVTGYYWCAENQLLHSLEGAPETVSGSFIVRYTPELPLLRLLAYPDFHLHKAPLAVLRILNSHKGTGKPGAIKAAVELIKAGYRENAKW
jgi:hypothetical protein